MRIRIALATAVAVLATPAIFFAIFSSTPAASARLTRHEASSQHRVVNINFKPMSYSAAEHVATMVTYANAVAVGQEETYLTEVAYLKAVAAQRQQQAAAQAEACGSKSIGIGSSCACDSRRRGRTRICTRPLRRRVRCDQHEHGRLGLYPGARVQRQLRRGERRRLPVRVRDVERVDRAARTCRGLPAGRPGRGRPQAVLPTRLGAVGDPLRLRALRIDPLMGSGAPGSRNEDHTEQQP